MVEMTASFELEIQALDDDHRALMELANRITDALDNEAAATCESLVADFVKLTKQHFGREEALLTKAGYPKVKKHHDHHRSLYGKMDHMLEFAAMAVENPLARESLKKELNYFVLDDVITADMEFKDFIHDHPPSA